MSTNKFRSDLKIIVIGNAGTGKTSFVNKWTKNIFNETYKATIVSEFGFKIFEDQNKLYRIQLWDLAGMDQNTCITKIFAKDAHGCVVVSDITNEKTLEATIKWKNSVDDISKFIDGDFLPSVLVQNKIDCIDESEYNIFDDRINDFCKTILFLSLYKIFFPSLLNLSNLLITFSIK